MRYPCDLYEACEDDQIRSKVKKELAELKGGEKLMPNLETKHAREMIEFWDKTKADWKRQDRRFAAGFIFCVVLAIVMGIVKYAVTGHIGNGW